MSDQTPLNPDAIEAAAAKVYPHHWNGDLESKLAQLPQFTELQAAESASRIRAEKLEEMQDHVSAYLAVAQQVVNSVEDLVTTRTGLALANAAFNEGLSAGIKACNDAEADRPWNRPVSPYSAPLLAMIKVDRPEES